MLSLKNFDYLTKLGEGQFGQVFLIKERKLGILFALKSVSKEAILAEGM
jgi:serine/threonine protein kinase